MDGVRARPVTPRTNGSGHRHEVSEDLVEGLYGDVRRLQSEVDNLRAALSTRAAIDQAKGMLMQRYGVDPDGAFALLRRWSSTANLKLHVVAEAMVEAAVRGSVTPHPSTAAALAQKGAPELVALLDTLTHQP